MLTPIAEFIKADWREHPVRCVLEITAWIMSIFCSLTMMLTVPDVPFLLVYPLFITQCGIFAWACRTRGSTGLLANYLLMMTIDSIALIKLLIMD